MSIQEQQARELLRDLGFYTDNLWSIEDVHGRYTCTDDEAYEVLENALENEATYEQIWMSIDFAAHDLELTEN